MMHPACFADASAYSLWLKPIRGVKRGQHGYCADCTPGYQKMMLMQGRCEYPGVTFKSYFGEMIGCRSTAELQASKARKI